MRYYLKDRGGIWYICWTDGGIPRRISTGLRDRREADLALARHVLSHGNPKHQAPQSVTLQAVVLRYWEHHGRHIASRDSVTATLKAVNTYLDRVTVAEFGTKRQEGFVTALKSEGLAAGTVKRWMGVIGAALHYAYARQEVTDVPPIVKVKAVDGEGVRPLSIDELRALCGACLHEHQRRFLLLALGTAARPGALIDLTWDRVDFQTGTIAQSVPGIDHGNKRRPRVPMPASVRSYLEPQRSIGPVVQWNGKRLASHKRLYDGLAERAGVDVSAYGIRKACATWMRQEGVPEWDVLGMLGHRAGGSQTERYAHWRPEFMRAAAESLGRLIAAVSPPWLASDLPAHRAVSSQVPVSIGGRTWDRTTDPYHVKDSPLLIYPLLRVANDD
jgi:integrase